MSKFAGARDSGGYWVMNDDLKGDGLVGYRITDCTDWDDYSGGWTNSGSAGLRIV